MTLLEFWLWSPDNIIHDFQEVKNAKYKHSCTRDFTAVTQFSPQTQLQTFTCL